VLAPRGLFRISKEELAGPDTSGTSLMTPTGHRRRQSALMLAARMTLAHFSVGLVHDEIAEDGGRTRNQGAAQLGDAPNFENRTQGGPGAVDAGVGTHRGNPTPWIWRTIDYPKAYPRQFITAL
jgi:hypothetical protein